MYDPGPGTVWVSNYCPSFRTFAPSGHCAMRVLFSLDVRRYGGRMGYSHQFLKDVLERTKRIAIAMVGVSVGPVRPCFYLAAFSASPDCD